MREFKTIGTSYAILLVLMGGIFVYGLLYNYMYEPNLIRDAPIAVVDQSHSALSRIHPSDRCRTSSKSIL